MTLSDDQFESEFDINNDKLVYMIVYVIKENYINNLDMLSIAAKVAKYVE